MSTREYTVDVAWDSVGGLWRLTLLQAGASLHAKVIQRGIAYTGSGARRKARRMLRAALAADAARAGKSFVITEEDV